MNATITFVAAVTILPIFFAMPFKMAVISLMPPSTKLGTYLFIVARSRVSILYSVVIIFGATLLMAAMRDSNTVVIAEVMAGPAVAITWAKRTRPLPIACIT